MAIPLRQGAGSHNPEITSYLRLVAAPQKKHNRSRDTPSSIPYPTR